MSERKKLMTIPVPFFACPVCNHQQFIVREIQIDTYLTGRDGDIVDHSDNAHICHGICCKCGHEIDMYPARNGFIPLTSLRKVLFDWTDDTEFIGYLGALVNPMEASNEKSI